MAYRKPAPSYFWVLVVSVVSLAAKMVANKYLAALAPYLENFPFVELSVFCLAFIVGMAFADLHMPNSALRHNLNEWRRPFQVLSCHISEEYQPHEHFAFICLMKFERDLVNADLTVTVTQHLPTPHGKNVWQVYAEKITVNKNTDKRLRFGSIPIPKVGVPASHAVWGEPLGTPDLGDRKSIVGGAPFTVEISVAQYKYRAYLGSLGHFAVSGKPFFFMLNEDDLQIIFES